MIVVYLFYVYANRFYGDEMLNQLLLTYLRWVIKITFFYEKMIKILIFRRMAKISDKYAFWERVLVICILKLRIMYKKEKNGEIRILKMGIKEAYLLKIEILIPTIKMSPFLRSHIPVLLLKNMLFLSLFRHKMLFLGL